MTIDQLATLTHKKRTHNKIFGYLKELLILAVVFGIAVLAVTIFTNANLFVASLEDTLNLNTPQQSEDLKKTMEQNGSISSIIDNQQTHEAEIKSLINKYTTPDNTPQSLTKDPEVFLAEHLKGYDFKFNTLPPTNRVIVPRFSVNDPLIVSQYTNMDEFIYKNYNEELKQGVVKYPTTPNPGQSGNTLIFGHTSEERWKYNHYSMAFAHIAQMNIGDIVQIVREGKLYEYKVVDIQVKYPQHVDDTYQQYANLSASNNKNYLTMMGCYPIGTAKQRMLVISEQITK